MHPTMRIRVFLYAGVPPMRCTAVRIIHPIRNEALNNAIGLPLQTKNMMGCKGHHVRRSRSTLTPTTKANPTTVHNAR